MTTPTLGAPAAPAAKPDLAMAAAAAMWRSLCALAALVDTRLTPDVAASDPGAVANLAHCAGGGDQGDAAVILSYVIANLGKD